LRGSITILHARLGENIMDRKEKQLVDYYYKKFSERSFDEKDVYSFLMAVGEHASEIRLIKELADFINFGEKTPSQKSERFRWEMNNCF